MCIGNVVWFPSSWLAFAMKHHNGHRIYRLLRPSLFVLSSICWKKVCWLAMLSSFSHISSSFRPCRFDPYSRPIAESHGRYPPLFLCEIVSRCVNLFFSGSMKMISKFFAKENERRISCRSVLYRGSQRFKIVVRWLTFECVLLDVGAWGFSW